MNNKGFTTIQLFVFSFIAFFVVVFIGLGLFAFNLVYDGLAIDKEVGQVNLKNVTDLTFGKVNTAFTDYADTLAVIVILGMALTMILSGYFLGGNYPKLMIIIDIFILVFCFIASIYISSTFDTLIHSTPYFDIYEENLPKSSAMILNLPIIITIIGALIMIFSYALIKQPQEINTYGY